MRVTHVVAHPPFQEGTGTACYYNARALIDLGFDVSVIVPHNNGTDAKLPDFYKLLPSWFSIENAYFSPQLLSLADTDILHLHFPYIFGSSLSVIKKHLSDIPLVVTYHNDLIGNGIRRPAFGLYNRFLTPGILQSCNKILVTSKDYAKSSIYADTIFENRIDDIVEIGNGVDIEQFRPGLDPVRARNRLQIGRDEVLLLHVSKLDRAHIRKGLFLLLDALAKLRHLPLRLLVIGDGNLREHYQSRARELRLDSRVTFAGRVSQEELVSSYAACDMVVVPSLPPEAFGLVLAQGMACAKAVIGSDIPGVRTLIQHGMSGLLVAPRDAEALAGSIAALAADPVLREDLGRCAARRVFENYSWAQVGRRLKQVYEEQLSL